MKKSVLLFLFLFVASCQNIGTTQSEAVDSQTVEKPTSHCVPESIRNSCLALQEKVAKFCPDGLDTAKACADISKEELTECEPVLAASIFCTEEVECKTKPALGEYVGGLACHSGVVCANEGQVCDNGNLYDCYCRTSISIAARNKCSCDCSTNW